jgi:hypothetical protein
MERVTADFNGFIEKSRMLVGQLTAKLNEFQASIKFLAREG